MQSLLLALAVLVCTTAVCSAQKQVVETFGRTIAGKKNVKIGCFGRFVGPLGGNGRSIINGSRLAVAEQGRKILGDDANVILTCVNTDCSESAGAEAFAQLVNMGVVGVIGGTCSSMSLGALPDANGAKVPFIAGTSSSPRLSVANDFFFRVVPSDVYQGAALARLVKRGGAKRVALVYENTAYGLGLANAFRKAFKPLPSATTTTEAGPKAAVAPASSIVTTYEFDPARGSVSAAINQIKTAKADAVVLSINDVIFASAFLKDVYAQKLNLKVYAGDVVMNPATYPMLLDNNFKPLEAVTGITFSLGSPEFLKRVATFAKTQDLSNVHAVHAYDSMIALMKAYAEAKAPKSGDQIAAALSTMKFTGESGVIAFDAYGDLKPDDTSYAVVKFDTAGKLALASAKP